MNQITATLLGLANCCVVPLLAFAAGAYYARFGLPFDLSWRGFGNNREEE